MNFKHLNYVGGSFQPSEFDISFFAKIKLSLLLFETPNYFSQKKA